ncbi:MAG: DUF1570 domain-containing protein [Pirellula sp.]|nr:DUF1570 domain-containing protein [Pirellula sp.]
MPYRTPFLTSLVLVVLQSVLASFSHADFIVYSLPGAKRPIILEGSVRVVSPTIVEFTYPGFSPIAINPKDVVAVKAPSRREEFKKAYAQATRAQLVDEFLKAAKLALQRGLIKEFYQCCSDAHKLEPQHPTLLRLAEARRRVKQPLGTHAETEKKLRELTSQSSMKVEVSQHYVMLHDTQDASSEKRSRAKKRLELLEQVYESFFLKFALDGVVLTPPKEHLMVMLFAEEQTYLRYATSLDPELRSASGFWSPQDNIGVFYDQGTTEEMKHLLQISEELKLAKRRARGTANSREVAQVANSLDLLLRIAREESDIEVVSHEAVHQLAGNTGIMPRSTVSLRWAHEGLASYFECPAAAGWAGVGAVNETRLIGYKKIFRTPQLAPLELLVTDLLFDAARSDGAVLDAYGYAWALTHFLMERRFQDLIQYYLKCSELQGDEAGRINRSELVNVFTESFGDIRKLEQEFHLYMDTLKTDVERMREAQLKRDVPK